MSDLDQRVRIIEERNQRVEADKAWETSWIRRGSIAAVTYACAVILLNYLEHDGAWKHALVPVMGYVLSTLSLPAIKKIWIERKKA
jgi:hypothetical protein